MKTLMRIAIITALLFIGSRFVSRWKEQGFSLSSLFGKTSTSSEAFQEPATKERP